MTDTQTGSQDSGSPDEPQSVDTETRFMKSLITVYKEYRNVLPRLPELMQQCLNNEPLDPELAESRLKYENSREGDAERSAERKRSNLEFNIDVKTKRTSVERELQEKEKLLQESERKAQCLEEECWKLKKELEKREIEVSETRKEQEERISAVKNESENKVKEISDKVQQLENQLRKEKDDLQKIYDEYQKARKEHKSSHDGMINELAVKDTEIQDYMQMLSKMKAELSNFNMKVDFYKSRNEDLTQQIRNREDQVKEYEAKYNRLTVEYKGLLANKDEELEGIKTRYNRLTEEYKGLLANKDEELEGIKTRNEDLTQQIRNKEDQVKEYEEKYNRLTEEYKGLLANKDEELEGIKTRFSELKERYAVFVERKDEELKKMKTSLAYLSEKQEQRAPREVKDNTSSDRPSEVEKDFRAFFDEARIDACEKMQEIYGSEEESEVGISYPRLACMIFETAYEEVKETKEAVLTLFKVIAKSMIDHAPEMGAEYASRTKGRHLPYSIPFKITPYRPELEYPIDVFDALKLSLKETAHKCDLESLERGVKMKIREKWLQWLTMEKSCRLSFSEHLLAKLSDYIKACIRLTWRMVIQVPAMQLEYQSPTLKVIHKNLGYHSSPEMCSRHPTAKRQASDEELEIACYLWPALLDGGGKLICAGEVLCKVK